MIRKLTNHGKLSSSKLDADYWKPCLIRKTTDVKLQDSMHSHHRKNSKSRVQGTLALKSDGSFINGKWIKIQLVIDESMYGAKTMNINK